MINGDGLQSRDFTFVGTVCDVIASSITRGVSSNSPVNLAFGTRHSLLDVIRNLEIILGKQLMRIHQQDRVGDVRHSQADDSLLASLFPETIPVSLDEGLRQTTAWLRRYLAIE